MTGTALRGSRIFMEMANTVRSSGSLFGRLNFPLRNAPLVNTSSVASVRGLKLWAEPPQYEPIDIPVNQRRLAVLEKVPTYPFGVRPMKVPKELRTIRGPETVNNRLLHNQYGIITLCGGFLRPGHIDMIRNTINKGIDTKTTFAVWRIDPPYKPITKKGQGKRMGSGKGAIDHYVTPVKAGRIVIELGGTIEFEQVRPIMQEVCYKLPVDAIPISQETLARIEAKLEERAAANINPFSLKRVIEYNMHGSDVWVGSYLKQHHGDYI
ncbi:39S ribosomal protein L16 [Tropilaelaps mercedesae]|uniref:Large ribosomal subunit protein uL16m n=1 Tax=Tropilaelaps mercedesae TaxID=418985 RepID=A0A1V9XWC5_9ACAR|nr:39S ribosomal protein L16 [Tropilaelaps mercedesae]